MKHSQIPWKKALRSPSRGLFRAAVKKAIQIYYPQSLQNRGDLSKCKLHFSRFFGGEGGSKKCSLHLDRSPPFLGFEDPLQETSETRSGGGGSCDCRPPDEGAGGERVTRAYTVEVQTGSVFYTQSLILLSLMAVKHGHTR